MGGWSDSADSDGHYGVLGVAVSASMDQIKVAYRRRAKDLHPDHNSDPHATAAFQRVVAAYQVLSDPQARARYDDGVAAARRRSPLTEGPPLTEGMRFGAGAVSGAGAATARGRGGPERAGATVRVTPVICCRCGAIPQQPRFVIFRRVIGLALGARRDVVQGVFCRRCADGRAVSASLTTWLLGWWGLPWGPVWAVGALWRNLRGGERPADVNAALLLQQARYFVVRGKRGAALNALDQALGVVQRPELRQKLQKMARAIGDSPRGAPMVDQWRPAASWAFYLQLVLVIVGIGSLALEVAMVMITALTLGFGHR